MPTKREFVIENFGGLNTHFPATRIMEGGIPKAQTAENCLIDEGGIPIKMGGRVKKAAFDNSTWTLQYLASVLPTDGSLGADAWVKTGSFNTEEIDPAGFLHLEESSGASYYDRNPTLSREDGTSVEASIQIESATGAASYVYLYIQGDSTLAVLKIFPDKLELEDSGTRDTYRMDTTGAYHTYRLNLLRNFAWVSVDGTIRLYSRVLTIAGTDEIRFALVAASSQTSEARFDYVYYQTTTHIAADMINHIHNFESREGVSSLLVSTGEGIVEIPDIEETTDSNNELHQERVLLTGLNRNYRNHMVNHFGKSYSFNGFDPTVVYDKLSPILMDEDTTSYGVPRGKYPLVYQNRIFLFNLQELPNGYVFTQLIDTTGTATDGEIIEPDTLRTDENSESSRIAWPLENRFEFKRGRSVVGASVFPEAKAMLVGQEDRMWIHRGGTPLEIESELEEQNEKIGLLSHETMKAFKGGVIFFGIGYAKKKGIFLATPDGKVERISRILDDTFDSIRAPILRHHLAGYARDFDAGTYSSTDAVGDTVQLSGTNTSGTWVSPIYYAEDIEAWGTFESGVTLDTNLTNNITFEIRSATTFAGVSGASYSDIVDGQKITEAVANKYIDIKATFARDSSGDPNPTLNFTKPSWMVNGEWQEMPWAVIYQDRYYLFCSDGDSSGSAFSNPNDSSDSVGYGTKYTNRCFVLQEVLRVGNQKTWEWTELTEDRWNISCAVNHRDNLYGGSSKDDALFQLDTGQADDDDPPNADTDITMKYKTGIIRAKNPIVVNRIGHRVFVETEGAASYDLIFSRDGSADATLSQTGLGTGRVITQINIPASRTFQELEIEIDENVDGDFKVHKIIIPYVEYPNRIVI